MSGLDRKDLVLRIKAAPSSGLERELLEYWQGNLSYFSDNELNNGLRQLATEVVEDLSTGPEQTIRSLKDLQKIVLNRRALHLDLTLSESALNETRTDLANFVRSITDRPFEDASSWSKEDDLFTPIISQLEKRYHFSREHAPWYVGFVNPDRTGGDVHFSSDFPGYSQVDRQSLIRVLSGSLFSGAGPLSFQTRTAAIGLAYHNGIFDSPALKRTWYYADRSPDIAALLGFVNGIASTVTGLKDPDLIDYALSNTFTFSRTSLSFSERGKAGAQDIRDGNESKTVHRFAMGLLELRKEPGLLSEVTHSGLAAICGVLFRSDCRDSQSATSIFFFSGSDQVLSEVEKRLSIPRLLKLYPSDFWIDFSSDASSTRF
jgi:hypothetical protein